MGDFFRLDHDLFIDLFRFDPKDEEQIKELSEKITIGVARIMSENPPEDTDVSPGQGLSHFRIEVYCKGKSVFKTLCRGSRQWCQDCKTKHMIDYILKDEVWLEAVGSTRGGILCINCLERRLGRKVIMNDFSRKARMNDLLWFMWQRELEHIERIKNGKILQP